MGETRRSRGGGSFEILITQPVYQYAAEWLINCHINLFSYAISFNHPHLVDVERREGTRVIRCYVAVCATEAHGSQVEVGRRLL